MSLTEPKDLMDVLARLDQARREPANESMRKYRRYSVRGEARIEPLDPAELQSPMRVLLRDVSRAGVGFLSDQFITPCTMWRMQMQTREFVIGSTAIMVRYCRPVQSDLYLCGGQVIIEPYLMHMLGIPADEARHADLCNFDEHDVTDFVRPEDDHES